MPSIEYQGMKFSGGKFFIILSLIGAIVGGGWSGYKFYDDYLTMKEQVQNYTAPDLSNYDEEIAVIKSELDLLVEEITIISDVARDMRSDMKTDLRNMENDVRHITTIVNDIEDRQKEDTREIMDELKIIEDELKLELDKSLNNPLAGLTSKN